MRQQTPLDYIPIWDYTASAPRMTMLCIFKVALYLVGIFVSECSLLGISFTIFGTATSRFNCITILVVFGTFSGSFIYFFRTRFKARCLPWLQYFWWILGATIVAIMVLALELAFIPNPNDKQLSTAIFGCIILLYSTTLAVIAHLKPSLHQQIDGSVRKILNAMPGRQLSLTELIACLQREHGCLEAVLLQYIETLDYIEQIDMPGTPIRVCCIKGTKITLTFPQVKDFASHDLRQKVIRSLSFLNEENVDIGIFLLSKEFEATLKIYILAAKDKGKIQIPVNTLPDKWKLDEMIRWVRINGIVADHAILNYLRQTRNDRAHGAMPSLTEKRILMMGVQYLANLYIDYIKLFDDLTIAL